MLSRSLPSELMPWVLPDFSQASSGEPSQTLLPLPQARKRDSSLKPFQSRESPSFGVTSRVWPRQE